MKVDVINNNEKQEIDPGFLYEALGAFLEKSHFPKRLVFRKIQSQQKSIDLKIKKLQMLIDESRKATMEYELKKNKLSIENAELLDLLQNTMLKGV